MGEFFDSFGFRVLNAIAIALIAWGGLVVFKVGAGALGLHGAAQMAAA